MLLSASDGCIKLGSVIDSGLSRHKADEEIHNESSIGILGVSNNRRKSSIYFEKKKYISAYSRTKEDSTDLVD